jgi:hypothetical protein
MDVTRVPISPLQVEIDRVGRYQNAESVGDLSGLLLSSSWPGTKGTLFHRALVSSLEALDFHTDGRTARKAFVKAAHAAGMHVLPDDMEEMRKPG